MRPARFAVARSSVCTLVAMAYDQELDGRIRQRIGSDPELTEKKMFGELAFLVRGNIAIARAAPWFASILRSRTPWWRRRRPRR
jgi:hypothetical protein